MVRLRDWMVVLLLLPPLDSMDGDIIEGDHIIPYIKGGDSNPDNLALLTKSDNRKKKDKILE